MKKVVRLTERDLTRIVKRVIREMEDDMMDYEEEDFMMDGEMEEGLFGPSKAEKRQRRKELRDMLQAKLVELGIEEEDLYKSLESTLNAAEENNYEMDEEDPNPIKVKRASDGRPFLIVKPPQSKFHKSKFYQNVMQPMVGGLKGGHTFGGGSGN